MFKYPNGRNMMNIIVWLVGVVQFALGVLVILIGVFGEEYSGLTQFFTQMGPESNILFSNGVVFTGLFVSISSFPIIIFAEVHMYTRQSNKMVKKMYDRIKT